jgi:alpha-glucosidase
MDIFSVAQGERDRLMKTPAILHISPPELGFYAKKLVYEGIPIKAHEMVVDAALREARDRLHRMLHNTPVILQNLVEAGVELHIIGRDQVTSDLPEHRHMKDKSYDGDKTIDERTRGVGGKMASCGEENLLKLRGDRYEGRDICVHEFAHSIYEFGLSPDAREILQAQFRRSTKAGLWKNAYASKNEHEFFAELSMWYFGTHGDYGEMSPPPRPGREWFQQYDPETFEVLDGIYSGQAMR